MVGPQLQLSAIEAGNPTVCLHGPKSTSDFMVGRQLLSIIVGTQFFNVIVRPQLQQSASMAVNPTLCLHGQSQPPTPWPDFNFSASLSELNFSTLLSDPNFNRLPQWQINQLSVYMAQSQLPTDSFSKSSTSQDRCFWALTSFTLQPHFLSGFYYDNCDCHTLCVRG